MNKEIKSIGSRNNERLEALQAPIRALVPDFDNPQELDDYLTTNEWILQKLNAYPFAYFLRHGFRPRPQETDNDETSI